MEAHDTHSVINATFGRIADRADQIADVFYERLFEAEPSARSLFDQRIDAQRQRFMVELGWLAEAAADLEDIRERVEALGVRHLGYGVQSEHYPLMRSALLDSFATVLEDWTDDQADAWGQLIDAVAHIMASAADNA